MARRKITDQKTTTDVSEPPDELVPDPQVARELGITLMTLWRWDRDPKLKEHMPPRMKVRRRNFRSRNWLENFKAWLLRIAIAQRDSGANDQAMKRNRQSTETGAA